MLPHSSSERRASPRCAIDLPIQIESHGIMRGGRTRDLSAAGLAITVPVPTGLTTGGVISFALVLQHLFPETPTRLKGTAVVVRVAQSDAGAVVALRAKWLTTVPAERALLTLVPTFLPEEI